MAKIQKISYATEERLAKIPESNWKKYKKYLQSSIVKNPDVKNTTYHIYQENFKQFLCWLANEYDDELDLYDEEFMDNAVDIMEAYMLFCQDYMKNHKKTVNNKVAAVSSFYLWSAKRDLIKYHPFKDKLDRMKKASEEHVINSYFLTSEQIDEIRKGIEENKNARYSIQDKILFELSLFSANRIGALERLSLSSLDLDNMCFTDIREKEGYRVEIPFDTKLKNLISEWLDMRENDYDKKECDGLLIHKYGGEWIPWKRSTIHYKMRKYGEIIGIPDYHCHCMRKTSIDRIYRDTGDLNLASKWANHKSASVTQDSYIKPMSKQELKDEINKLARRNELLDSESKDFE